MLLLVYIKENWSSVHYMAFNFITVFGMKIGHNIMNSQYFDATNGITNLESLSNMFNLIVSLSSHPPTRVYDHAYLSKIAV